MQPLAAGEGALQDAAGPAVAVPVQHVRGLAPGGQDFDLFFVVLGVGVFTGGPNTLDTVHYELHDLYILSARKET